VAEVLVLVERAGDSVRKTTLELLTIARRLGEPAAVLRGSADAEVVEILGRHGAATVYSADSPEFDDYLIAPSVELLAGLAGRTTPAAVLVTAGPDGTEIGARLAVCLGSGIITNATDVQAGPDGPIATQSVFAGSWQVQSQVSRGIPVIAVRPNSAPVEQAPTHPAVEKLTVTFSDAARAARVTSRIPKADTGRPDLTDAAVVVAGGRGVGSAEAFSLIEEVADTFGAAVAATRAVTDLSWYPHEFQVGQTGKTVAPRLYLASGVSGAIQHRAGMQGSQTIVAINKDPKAPIFSIADFGVVGDLHTVLPALVDEIKKRKA
jgi:electron transfer flavoprotein alpha subunit